MKVKWKRWRLGGRVSTLGYSHVRFPLTRILPWFKSRFECWRRTNLQHSDAFSDHRHGVHSQFSHNQELSYISHQPFTPPMRTSSRPWCRPVFTQLQRRGLEKRFQVTKYVTKRERLQIGAMLGLSETQVKVWFQNRRTKWRHEAARREKKQKEQAINKAKENQKQETSEVVETRENDEECLSSNEETLLEESWLYWRTFWKARYLSV